MFHYSRSTIFGTLLLLMGLEIAWFWTQSSKIRKSRGGDIEDINEVRKYIEHYEGKPQIAADTGTGHWTKPKQSAIADLKDRYLSANPDLFHVLAENLDLTRVDALRAKVLTTSTLYNIDVLPEDELQLFINLEKINNIRFINRYFLQVHRKLVRGGYFILRKTRLETFRESLDNRFPRPLAFMIYGLYFTWYRVCPKLPGCQKLYFLISKGEKRVFSRAEIAGRLYFCGFHLLGIHTINGEHWYIAQKNGLPSTDLNPSYGPLIKLKRVGYQGKLINVYKLRTMHPYAEYLQDYVYQQNQLDESGKLRDDFRMTEWGRVFRKFWIDEVPQFVNLMRGEMRLFGVRALSRHYYSLYPPDVQNMRIRHKPGLVPPFYADMPKSFEDIIESERQYLIRKEKEPWKTDVIYFARAVMNILFRHARSH
ncbi:MAG: sugar transferase [candidate division KSB1 bacterium]|nr:sugar transferase [candidate division KSB1 bacterium]